VRCHGENGEGSEEKLYPHPRPAYEYIVRQFRESKDGKRATPTPPWSSR